MTGFAVASPFHNRPLRTIRSQGVELIMLGRNSGVSKNKGTRTSPARLSFGLKPWVLTICQNKPVGTSVE